MLKFFKRLSLFLLPLCLMPVLTYLIDPFGIFREDFSRQVIEPNQHYAKMKFLTEELRDYDSFVFGSSKAGNLDTRKLTDGNYYNLSYSMGIPYEWYQDINLLLESGYDIKNLIITLDELSYSRTHHQNNSFLRTPYAASAKERMAFKIKYLFRIPDFRVMYHAFYPLHKDKDFLVAYDIHDTGIPFKTSREAYVDANMGEHLKDPRFDDEPRIYLVNMEESLEYVAKIRDLCEDKGIKLTVILTPVHERKMKALTRNRFQEYKDALAQITPYYDFSIPGEINRDNRYWFELHHFRMQVGDMMISRITSGGQSGEFGTYVHRLTEPPVRPQIPVHKTVLP